MTIYDDYIAYHEKYTKVYGEKTIIFLQVGDFFELYAVQNENENAGPDLYAIGDMCNIVITRKNKSIPENSRANPLMAGFPIHAYQKQAQLLVNANYTVVIIRQVTPPPNPKRDVTEIISPSTYINNNAASSPLTSYLITFVWSIDSIGMAGIDLCTGSSWVYETLQGKDVHFARDEAYRLLQVYQPREILIRGTPDICEADRKIILELLDHPCMHVQWETHSIPITVQNAIIEKAYNNKAQGLLTPIEQVGIEHYDLGRMAFIHVLQFAYEHNETIIDKLQLPKHIANERHLTLEYNSTLQLNVLSLHAHEKSLLQLLNRTSTSLGNRRFRQWLLTPLIDPMNASNNMMTEHTICTQLPRSYEKSWI
jgi:DNA mismatch repair protein MutS